MSILASNMESAGAVRLDCAPGVNQFICRSAQNNAAAQSKSMEFGHKREKLRRAVGGEKADREREKMRAQRTAVMFQEVNHRLGLVERD